MKLWIDDIRPASKGYFWCKSVNEAKNIITKYSNHIDFDNNLVDEIELIDIDYDATDYIRLLDWLEEIGKSYPIHVHNINPI